MEISIVKLWILVLFTPMAISQYEEDFREKGQKDSGGGSSEWYWNSTTTANPVDSLLPTTVKIEDTTVILGEDVLVLDDADDDANETLSRSLLDDDVIVPTNFTSGRSSKALNLDFVGGIREGRIINDDPGNRKLSLQGFIPIVSFSAKDGDQDDNAGASSKSSKRVPDDDLYYNGPYPPQPIGQQQQQQQQQQQPQQQQQQQQQQKLQEEQAKLLENLKNYYTGGTYPPHPKPVQPSLSSQAKHFQVSSRPVDSQTQNFFQSPEEYRPRPSNSKVSHQPVAPPQSNHDFYIPPTPQSDVKQQNTYIPIGGSASKEAVRYISSGEFGKRLPQQPSFFPDSDKSAPSNSNNGHFSVTNNQEVTYAQAGPYPPEPIPQEEYPVYQKVKETTAKQFRPGKQFDPSQDAAFDYTGAFNGFNGDLGLGEERCICVPFYMCRNGVLVNYGRALEPADQIDERTPKKVSKRSSGNETVEAKDSKDNVAPYAADVASRVVGLSNVGESCGLLRRCCRVPRNHAPGGLLPFSPDNYPIPPIADFDQLPPGLIPPGFTQEFPQQIQRPHRRPPHEQQAFVVQEGNYPFASPHQEQVIVVPQDVRPHRRPKPLPPRPVYPQPKPVNPYPQPQPVYPKPKPRPRPQPVYPQPKPVYPHPQPEYPRPQPDYPRPQPEYPRPQPQYPRPQPEYPFQQPQSQNAQCGARNGLGIHGRVKNLQYHDDASEFGEYPWQAAILLKVGPGNNLFVCGGTLISNLWVATAAHCLKKHHAEELKVRLGDWDVHRDDEFYPYVEKFVTEVVPHPEFYPGNLQNDIALLRLESPVDPSLPHISPACLPEPHERFDGGRCWVTGWGKNAFGQQGEYQSVLKEVDVPMIGHKDCEHRLKQTRLGPYYQLHPGFLCAGGEPGKDACTGDGGSPLVCDSHGVFKVAGLVSWGIGCGQPGVPGIYVNMAKYRTWMDTVLNRYG